MTNKNLEAENQVFKGIFRAPFSFIVGGPVGLFANTVYTFAKYREEITREKRHKEYIESIYKKTKGIDYILDNEKKEKENELNNKRERLSFLRSEFDECKDISSFDNLRIKYYCEDKKCATRENRAYRASFIFYDHGCLKSFGATYLPEKDFIDRYINDMNNNSIVEKMRIYDNSIRGTFCYKTNDDCVFTGMFTQI